MDLCLRREAEDLRSSWMCSWEESRSETESFFQFLREVENFEFCWGCAGA